MMPMKQLLGGALVLSVVALPLSEVIAAPPPPASTTYTVGQFNMAGGHAEHGQLGNEAPDALIRSIHDRKPAFVTLQEGCRDWSDHLAAKLTEYKVVFDPVLTGSGQVARCEHPSDFGNAIIYRKDLGIDSPARKYSLGSPRGFEQREMLCVKSRARKLAICTLHLSSGDNADQVAARRAEAAKARALLGGPEFVGFTQLVGGDLNDDPMSDVADHFYAGGYGHGARGEFKEVDSPCGDRIAESLPGETRCRYGEATHSREKIDYLFASPSVSVRSADATHALHSDHDPLWASVTLHR